MSYAGLRTNRSRRHKYDGCEHSKSRGITVRLLTLAEIDEFKAHIQRIIDPSLRSRSKFRKAVV